MTKEQLDQKLKVFFANEEEMLAEIYFILKIHNETVLRLADIEEPSQIELTKQFIERIKQDILDEDQMSIISISSADERTNVIYEYDIEETPRELEVINHLRQNEGLPTFSFDNDKLEDIRGFLILIGNDGKTLILFKKHYPVNLYRKDSFSLTRGRNRQRFTKLKDDIIKVNSNFEFFQFDKDLFIKDLKALEKFFGFHDVIKRKAQASLELIGQSNILDNPLELQSLVEDISYARKLTKVAKSSPVLGTVPTEAIISFAENYPALRGKFKFNEDKSKIHLHTKLSKKLFIKLLNDDYLQSQLTSHYYESFAKDTID